MSRFFQVIIRSAHGGALLKSNDKYNKKKRGRKKEIKNTSSPHSKHEKANGKSFKKVNKSPNRGL